MKSRITAELLRATVGVRSGRPLIDKLVEPLNEVLPAYGITTEYRVAAFLATCAPESDWYKTLREYGKGAGRKYGRAINGLVYYGRGIFQVTWLRNYQLFTEYVAENWDSIKLRAAKYGFRSSPDFVTDPELLATPYWAVEAACWYWKANGLMKHADRGLKGFFGLQGLVNRGSAEKKALHYDARLSAYETARRVFPDDFALGAAAASAERTEGVTSDEQLVVENPIDAGKPSSSLEPSPLNNSGVPTPPTTDSVVVEKEEKVGFFKGIKLTIAGWWSTIGGTEGARQYVGDAQTYGITWNDVLQKIVLVLIAAFVIWFICRGAMHLWKKISQRWLTTSLIDANSTPTNRVIVAESGKLDDLAAAGWNVVERK